MLLLFHKELSKSIIKSVAEKLLENSTKKVVSNFLDETNNISVEKIEKMLDEINLS